MNQKILIVDDDKNHSLMLTTLLHRKTGYEAVIRQNGKEALEYLSQENAAQRTPLVVLDINMPVMGGMETLEIIRQRYPDMPVIMLTGNQDMAQAVQAIKLGATDFINKPYEGERLAVTVRNALNMSSLAREVRRLNQSREGTVTFESLIGHEAGLMQTLGVARKASAADIPVLITGETGTGKEVMARAIHGESKRAGSSFVAVNCGAIPAQLVESVLFGHEKGAFTGAIEKTSGKFREAEGGTIFLDEVGELPLETQVKLLRAIQQKEVEPVGAARPVAVNVRIISATNRNLTREVAEGRFREDLFFRLNVLQIEMPPLRERKEDIPRLAEHFIARFCARQAWPPKPLSEGAIKILKEHDWPGNVRQLENMMNRALVLSDGPSLEAGDLILNQSAAEKVQERDENTQPSDRSAKSDWEGMFIGLFDAEGKIKSASDIEREALLKVLDYHGQNVTASAKALNMAKSTFYRKLSEAVESES